MIKWGFFEGKCFFCGTYFNIGFQSMIFPPGKHTLLIMKRFFVIYFPNYIIVEIIIDSVLFDTDVTIK